MKLYFGRLQTWYRKESGKGIGLFEIMSYRLPRILAVKTYRQLAAIANDRFVDKAYNHQRFKEFQIAHQHRLGDHFYIIVMPNILHFLITMPETTTPQGECVFGPEWHGRLGRKLSAKKLPWVSHL